MSQTHDNQAHVVFTHDPDRMAKAGIPPRFLAKTLDTYEATTPAQETVLEWCREFAKTYKDSPTCGLFIGSPGTGKTHLAIGIALDAALTDYIESIFYTTVSKIIQRVKDSWDKDPGETEKRVRLSITDPRLLIIDEVGVQYGSDFERNILFDVMNTRYENLKPTILISNLPLSGVTDYLGERVMDRLSEDAGKVFVFDWESHRKNGGTKT